MARRHDEKYLKIKAHLLGLIRRGLLRPGQKIPSEYLLASRFAVNKTTANKAVALLVSEGFLARKQGAGTFVANEFAAPVPAIGFYTNLRAGSYFQHLMIGAQEEAAERGYGTMFFQAPGWEMEIDLARFWNFIRATGIKGLIINRPFQKALRQLPSLFLDTSVPSRQVDQVQVDNVQGGRLLAGHLIECGHTQAAFVSQDPSRDDLRSRAAGFFAVFERRKLFDTVHRLAAFSPAKHNLFAVLRQLLLADHRITAIAFDSDHVAHRAIPILRKLGKRVPQDISVTGFGNVAPDRYAYRLTSVEQHPASLGHLAAGALIDRIEGLQKGRIAIQTPVELVKGDTVVAIRRP